MSICFLRAGILHWFNSNERIIKAVNSLNRDRAQQILFAWNDIHGTRKTDCSLFVFMNDLEQPVRSDVTGALKEYDVVTVPWTKREEYVEELAA